MLAAQSQQILVLRIEFLHKLYLIVFKSDQKSTSRIFTVLATGKIFTIKIKSSKFVMFPCVDFKIDFCSSFLQVNLSFFKGLIQKSWSLYKVLCVFHTQVKHSHNFQFLLLYLSKNLHFKFIWFKFFITLYIFLLEFFPPTIENQHSLY